jgi:predicted lactoylglutathione lyase
MKMNYFVFGTRSLADAVGFYDALFAGTDINQIHVDERMTVWTNGDFMFAVAEPFDGGRATHGNGTMVGLNLASDTEVTRLYNKALEIGGTSEGEPGIRSGRFAAYVRDLDHNKICLFV